MLNYWLNTPFGFFNLGDLYVGDDEAKVLAAIAQVETQYIKKQSYTGNFAYDSYTIQDSISLEINTQTKKLSTIRLRGSYKGKFAGLLGLGDSLKSLFNWATTAFLSFDEVYLMIGLHQNLTFKTDWDEDMGEADKLVDLLRQRISWVEIGERKNRNPVSETYLLNWLEWFSHKRMPNYPIIPNEVMTEFQKLCVFEMASLEETLCFEQAAAFCDEWIEYIPFDVVKAFYTNWLRLKPNEVKLWRACIDKLVASGYLLENGDLERCYEFAEELETQLNTKFEQLKQKINAKIQVLENLTNSSTAQTELLHWQKIQAADSQESLNNLLSSTTKLDLPQETVKNLLKYIEVKKAFY